MRLELLATKRVFPETIGDRGWEIGAAVVRGNPGGAVVLDLGPADGPPQLRFTLTADEALRLGAAVQTIAHGGGERIILGD